MRKRIKILLAGPTPLYAPVYIAKQAVLTHVFNQIDIVHALPDYASPRDRIYDGLLNKDREHDVKLVIADPLRLFELIRQNQSRGIELTKSNYFQPKVVGGLVLNQSFHHIYDPDGGSRLEDVADPDAFFVTSEEPTTGFVVACNALDKRLDPALGITERYSRIKQTLISHGKIGLVKEFYQRAKRYNRKKKFSYFTPSSAGGDRVDNGGEFLVTGLVTTKEYYEANSAIIEEIIFGIHLGVLRVLNHPEWTQRHMAAYVSRNRWSSSALKTKSLPLYLEQLKNHSAYNTEPELRFNKAAFDAAVAARNVAHNVRCAGPSVSPAAVAGDVWREYFESRCSPPRPITRTDERHDERYDAIIVSRRERFWMRAQLLMALLVIAIVDVLLCHALRLGGQLPQYWSRGTWQKTLELSWSAIHTSWIAALQDAWSNLYGKEMVNPLCPISALIIFGLILSVVSCFNVADKVLRRAIGLGFTIPVLYMGVIALQVFTFGRLLVGWETAIGISFNFVTIFGTIIIVATGAIPRFKDLWLPFQRKIFGFLCRRGIRLEYYEVALDKQLQIPLRRRFSSKAKLKRVVSKKLRRNSKWLNSLSRGLEA